MFPAKDLQSLAVAVGLIVTLLCLVSVYRIFFHPLANIPGPFMAKITGEWRNSKYRKGNWHEDVLILHKKYGRVVRIAPNEVAVVDEHAMKNLYSHSHNADKTNWYDIWNPPGGETSLFSTTDRKIHNFLRKRLTQAYSMTSILTYEKHIQGCIDLLLFKLGQNTPGQIVDMSSWTNALAFDVVGELAYGEQLGHLKTGTDVGGFRKDIFEAFAMLATIGHYRIIPVLLSSKTTAALLPPPFGDFLKWSENKVKDRVAHLDEDTREDMLSRFCRMKNPDGTPVGFYDIFNEAMVLVGAGTDTTSAAMKACLYYLSINPKDYRLLQEEIDNFYEENKLGGEIMYLQTQQLPMLQAVIKESTRLFPSINFQLLRYAPENFVIRGHHIPAGTSVGISPIAQNRDPEIWGDDADEFRPGRWLQSEAQSKHFDSSTMTFGGNGPRMCIGKNVALVEIYLFVAQFIRHFDFELPDPKNPWRVTSYWFSMQHDFNLKVTARKAGKFKIPNVTI
ncbi:hypothetical protein TWF694_006734 [Orbilia ellipsospora]|uniref:Cytochrome P450 n=1 Tax=Orbilia ellipsospora TaxID=2528407 RepID=A0AAV9XL06_9PEZI